LSLNLEAIVNDKGVNFEEFLMLADFKNYLPDDIFVKVDRASMHYSLETRSPLLDEEIIEFTKKIPTSFKISGVSKRILRDVGSKYVPKDFFNRPKQGFSLPLETLLSTQLADLLSQCREYLLHNCSHLIPKQTINNAMRNGQNSLRSPKFTWNLVVFALWHEYYFNTKI
jgi:asparagine synthase (glutamine-hydrolysing)